MYCLFLGQNLTAWEDISAVYRAALCVSAYTYNVKKIGVLFQFFKKIFRKFENNNPQLKHNKKNTPLYYPTAG
jgi:hypothetical protein